MTYHIKFAGMTVICESKEEALEVASTAFAEGHQVKWIEVR